MSQKVKSFAQRLTDEQAEIEAKALAEFQTAVDEQLARLNQMAHSAKRKRTVMALMEAEVQPNVSRRDVFKRKGVISSRVFYDTTKDWFHDELFRDVLENCLDLART